MHTKKNRGKEPATQSRFLLEQRLSRRAKILLTVNGRSGGARIRRLEEITEIRSIFLADDLGRGFATLIVGGGIIVLAIAADMKVSATFGAFIPTPWRMPQSDLGLAIETIEANETRGLSPHRHVPRNQLSLNHHRSTDSLKACEAGRLLIEHVLGFDVPHRSRL